jgi:hypothetical protein
MNTFGGVERRWTRTGSRGAAIGVRGPVIVALLACAAFGCSFALARVLHSSAAARGEAAPSLPVASVSAAIPARLASVQPLESTLEPPAPPPPRTKSSAQAAPAGGSQAEASATPPPQSSESSSRAAAPASPPAEAPAPRPAPPPSSSSGGTSHHAPSSSGGGSFESSG